MDYEAEELFGSIDAIFNPEPVIGNEGEEFYETPPQDRLTAEFGLDTSYWKPFEYGADSALMRRTGIDDNDLSSVIQAQQAPYELFLGTIRLFADSIILHHNVEPRHAPYRYYPAILMSAWASFEAFVRVYSELLVKTAGALPKASQAALLETEERIEKNGVIRSHRKLQPLLDRYWWLLKFGYGVEYDRGTRIWQLGQSALTKRNELVHYEVSNMPSLTATELLQHLESILLLLIGPSAQIRISVMPRQYELYGVLIQVGALIEEFEERPFFKDKPVEAGAVVFPCPFQTVDDAKYPTPAMFANRLLQR